jgi:SagB-type dehydrogenase family enzyme
MLATTLIVLAVMQQGAPMIQLPEPEFTNASIEECIASRRSVRAFRNQGLDLQETAMLLWAGQGITDKARGFRAAPSAGATYPLVLYYATELGLFKYVPQSHAVVKTSDIDPRKSIARAALNQMFIADAGMVIVITARFANTTARYGERGVRYVYNEAGHCAQNIHLEAVALGLASVPVGAYDDNELKDVLGLEQEEPLYIIPVGYPR